MVVVAKNGVFTHELCTMRDVGDVTTDRHRMILNDSPNSWLGESSKKASFEDIKKYINVEDIKDSKLVEKTVDFVVKNAAVK